jgi:RNA recognition motif-containing protein
LNIYVGNLPKNTNEEAVRATFSAYGEVSDVKLIKDKYTNELRGFGFVEMPSKADALKAIESANGSDMGGHSITVNEAKPRENRNQGFSRNRSW